MHLRLLMHTLWLLVIVQERSSFPVLADNSTLLSSTTISAEQFWSCNCNREDEQNSCDDERKDPLQSNNFGGQLTKCECYQNLLVLALVV